MAPVVTDCEIEVGAGDAYGVGCVAGSAEMTPPSAAKDSSADHRGKVQIDFAATGKAGEVCTFRNRVMDVRYETGLAGPHGLSANGVR